MGVLTNIINARGEEGELERYLWTPFPNDPLLVQEMSNFWRPRGFIVMTEERNFRQAFSWGAAEDKVLYILAHSGREVSYLTDSRHEKTISAQNLVDYLTTEVEGSRRLPEKILALKIWACFTGVNGFAQQVQSLLLTKQLGYNPIVFGYNEVTGHPGDNGKSDQRKHVWNMLENGERGSMIGRASEHRTRYG